MSRWIRTNGRRLSLHAGRSQNTTRRSGTQARRRIMGQTKGLWSHRLSAAMTPAAAFVILIPLVTAQAANRTPQLREEPDPDG